MPVLLIALVSENRFPSGCIYCREFLIDSGLKGNVVFIVFAGEFNHTWHGCERDTKIEPSNGGGRH